MAIQTGKFLSQREEEASAKSIAAQLSKASAGEKKRKGRSGLFGKVGGFLAGEALDWGAGLVLAGLTGGAVNPQTIKMLKALSKGGKYAKVLKTGLKGAGMFAGKAAAHQATTGKWDKALGDMSLKTSGQVGEITADSKYGYGKEEAKTLSEELSRSRESEQDFGTFVGDVAGAYASDFAGKSLGDIFGGTEWTPEGGKYAIDEIAGMGQGDVFTEPSIFDKGGRVPKFKKGGGLFKKFGKKKEPERDEVSNILGAILSGGYEKKEGKHEYPMGYTVKQDVGYEDGMNLERIISKVGDFYYPGEGKSRSSSLAQKKAMFDAASRAYHSPADSITTDQLAKLKELGLFAGGGMVDGENSSPTIVDYFSRQGKTLGGSNTQSLSKILGR